MKPIAVCVLFTLAAGAAGDVPTVEPKDLAAQLSSQATKPVTIHVGPVVMFRGKHISGSIYAGPGAKAEGIEMLKSAVAKVPREREIVVYCGCCPWENCPNINPAVAALRQMGFTKVKALHVATNFAADWTAHGYPVELGPAAAK